MTRRHRHTRIGIALTVLLLAVLFAGPVLAQGLMSQQTYNRLERIHDMMDEEEFDDALSNANTARERAQNDHERAVIAQLIGFIHINLDNYEDALEEFVRAVEFDDGLPTDPKLNTIVNIAQLHAQFENWEESLEYVDRYLEIFEESHEEKAEDEREDPPSRIYLVGAQAHMQMDNLREALPYIKRAIELEDEPNESYYRVLLGIYFELEEYRDAIETLETMVTHWPDEMDYWFQMFSLNVELEDEEEALSVLKLAHRKGLFERSTHYINLYRMYMLEGAPFDAARILEEGMDNEVVERDEEHLDMLSRALIRAQEHERAVAVLEELGELKESGEAELTMAQLHQEKANWVRAREAALRAYEKGGLDNPGQALLLAGRSAAEDKDYEEAIAIFQQAMEYEDVQRQASQWVQYVEEEQQLMEQ